MPVFLLAKMLHILVLCPVLLIGGVQTLTIDSQLGTSVEDCFERISIGEQLPSSAIYRNVSELTTRECEQICKQDKQCQAYDYGVGAKGNATCNLSTQSEKEVKEGNLTRHPDYDVYVRRFQCEQSPPKPIQVLLDEPDDPESSRPHHRPVFRPDVDDRPLTGDYLVSSDIDPYNLGSKPQSQYRPDDISQKPAYDVGPSYGDHKPQDISYPERPKPDPYPNDPYRPSRPERPLDPYRPERPDPYRPERPNGPYRPERPDPYRPGSQDSYRPNRPQEPYRPQSDSYKPKPESNDVLQFEGYGKPRPEYSDKPDPYRPEKPNYNYIIRPNRKPRPENDYNKPTKPLDPLNDGQYGHPTGPIGPPYKPEKPTYSYNSQYASNYGQNSQNDNSVYVEIYDPPRPYVPIKDRPIQHNYDQGFLGYGTYSNQNSYTQSSQNSGSYSGYITEISYDHDRPDKPQKPGHDRPGYGKPSGLKGQNDYNSHNDHGSYGLQTGYQRPNDRYKPQTNQNSYGSNQNTYSDQTYQSSYGSHNEQSQSSYGYGGTTYQDNGESGYQKPQKPSYNRPSYGGDKGDYGNGYGSQGSYQSSQGYKGTSGSRVQSSISSGYGNSQSYGQNGYGNQGNSGSGNTGSYSNQASYGSNQGSYNAYGSYSNSGYGNRPVFDYETHKPAYGSDTDHQKPFGNPKPDYDRPKPGYGGNPDYDRPKPGYGNERPDSGYDSAKPGYGSDRPDPGYKPGYGNDRPKPGYGNERPDSGYDSTKPGYGNDRPDPGYGSTKPGYESERPDPGYKPGYGSERPDPGYKPGYGSERPDPGYGNTKPGYGNDRPNPGHKPGYGNDRPKPGYGNERPDPGYGSTKPGYGNDRPDPGYKPGYGNERPDPGYGSGKPGYGSERPDPGYGSGKPGYGSERPDPGYGSTKPDGNQRPGYGNEKPGGTGYGSDRPDVKPVYEYEMDKPTNVPTYISRPGGEIVTSRPVVIGDYERPIYKDPGMSYAACFRRVLAGRRALRSFVRKVVPCERLEDCRRECALEKRFHCESFNYRLDQSFRGKGLCELMTKPIEAFDQQRDFVDDKNYDFYEVDRNSLEPNCPESLRGPGSLHSGFLSSNPEGDRRIDQRPNRVDQRPNRVDFRPNRVDQSGWRDRHDWAGGFNRFSYDDRRFYDERGQGNRRYEDHFVPYQIGQARTDDQDTSWGQYGGSYGGQYKDRNDHHKSINYWGLTSPRPTDFRKSHHFDYHSLGKNLDFGLSRNDFHDVQIEHKGRYGYGSWKRGRWDNSGIKGGFEGFLEGRDEGAEQTVGTRGIGSHDSNECFSKRRPGMSLKSGAIRRSLIARNVVECEAACFAEAEFKCVSYSYRYSTSRGTDNCFLSERPYRGLEMSADSGSDVYGMPQDKCAVSHRPWVESECFWHVRSDTAVSGSAVKASLTVAGLGACEAECIRAQGFFCRGFSFRFDAPTIGDEDIHNCILTSSPTTKLSRTDTSGHELYARGNFGRGCEPAVYDDAQNGECYLQYDKAAKLTGAAIRGQARVKDEQTCGTACTEAPFRCLSFSFNNNASPSTDNCLLSEIRLFDLQRGVDYIHSVDDWLFAFDLFNSKCWRKVHGEEHSSELPHPISLSEDHDHFHGSEPSGPPSGPGYIPDSAPELPYFPDSAPPSGPSGPSRPYPQPDPYIPTYESGPSNPDKTYPIETYKPPRPILLKPDRPSFRPEPEIYRPGFRPPDSNFRPPEVIIPYKPEYPDPEPYRPDFRPERPNYNPRPDYNPGYRPERPIEIYPKPDIDRPGINRPGIDRPGIDRPGINRPSIDRPGINRPGYLPERPAQPQKPVFQGDRENGPTETSWRHYTVSGFPCRAGTTCAQNQIVGHWACEPEGGEIGSWDYCCAPTHRCGYSEGFHKPWCYVGHKQDQWRPCSEKYYPYHHHNVPHPSQGQREPSIHRPWRDVPNSPWPIKVPPPPADYTPHWDKPPGPYLSEADKKYWDNLYEDGPKAYYDQHGNPLPGYSKVPTEDRPYIRYKHNDGPPPSPGHWVPVSDRLPPVPGLGAPRYWPVAYLHRGPPPNVTYFRYNEVKSTTEQDTNSPRGHPESRADDDGLNLDDRRNDGRNGHSRGGNDGSRSNGDDSRGNRDDSRDNNYNSRNDNSRDNGNSNKRNDDSRRNNDDSRESNDSRRSNSNSRGNGDNRDYDDSRRRNDDSRHRNDDSRSNDDNFRNSDNSRRNNDDSRGNDDNYRNNNNSRRNNNDSRYDDSFEENNGNSRSNDNTRVNDKPNNDKRDETRDEKKINDSKTDDIFNTNVDKIVNKSITTEKPIEKVNNTDVEFVKTEDFKTIDNIKGIDDKLDDFSKSIEVLDIEDAKGEKLSDLKTLEAEERQIEAIGRLLASRRGSKLVLEKRSQKDLDAKHIAVDKDIIDFNFGNKFPTERRGVIKRISKDELERDRGDKSLEVSETTFVRPPRVLSTTDNIRKAFVNGKVFYDATIRDQREIFANNTRKPKNLRRSDNTTPSIINNNNFGRKKIIRTRNTNPVRRVKRVYRKRYNPEEVRRRLLERDRGKNSTV